MLGTARIQKIYSKHILLFLYVYFYLFTKGIPFFCPSSSHKWMKLNQPWLELYVFYSWGSVPNPSSLRVSGVDVILHQGRLQPSVAWDLINDFRFESSVRNIIDNYIYTNEIHVYIYIFIFIYIYHTYRMVWSLWNALEFVRMVYLWWLLDSCFSVGWYLPMSDIIEIFKLFQVSQMVVGWN